MNIDLNRLSNEDLVNHVEQELERYINQQGMIEVGYGSVEMRHFQVYERQLQRALLDSEKAVEVHTRVKALLNEVIPQPVQKKVLSPYEYNQRMNQRFNSRI